MAYVSVPETSQDKSGKEEPHLVDDMDFMEAGNVEVARGPFAAHIDKSDISVRQVCHVANVFTCCLRSDGMFNKQFLLVSWFMMQKYCM